MTQNWLPTDATATTRLAVVKCRKSDIYRSRSVVFLSSETAVGVCAPSDASTLGFAQSHPADGGDPFAVAPGNTVNKHPCPRVAHWPCERPWHRQERSGRVINSKCGAYAALITIAGHFS
jgi:hypothetical protein